MRITMLFLLLAVVSSDIAAQNWKHIEGSAQDKKAFEQLIASCRGTSTTFSGLASAIGLYKIPVRLVEPKDVYVVGAFRVKAQNQPHFIALKHVNKYPIVSKDTSGYIYPKDVPSWATTRCMVLAHELAEARYAVYNDAKYADSHAYAIAMENLIRREYGSDQCRSKDTTGNEAKDVPHTDHNDLVIRIGYHTERVHRRSKNQETVIEVTYEVGKDRKCGNSDYDAVLN